MPDITGDFILGYTSNVSQYSGIFQPGLSYKKFDIVYDTGNRRYYYATKDAEFGGGASLSASHRFSFENNAPSHNGKSGHYFFDHFDRFEAAGNQFKEGQTVIIEGSTESNDGKYKILDVESSTAESPVDWSVITGVLNVQSELFSWDDEDPVEYLSSWFFNPHALPSDHRTRGTQGRFWQGDQSRFMRLNAVNSEEEISQYIHQGDSTFWDDSLFGMIYIKPSDPPKMETWFNKDNIGWLWASTGTINGRGEDGYSASYDFGFPHPGLEASKDGFVFLGDAENSTIGPTGWTFWSGRAVKRGGYWSPDACVYNYTDTNWYVYDSVDGGSVVSSPPGIGEGGSSDPDEGMFGLQPASPPTWEGLAVVDKSTTVPSAKNLKGRLWLQGVGGSDVIYDDEASGTHTVSISTIDTSPSSGSDYWTTDKFFFDADYGSNVTFKANNRRFEYGNGYYIVQPQNINSLSAEFNLDFKGRTNREANAIVHFLENHQGQHEIDSSSPNLRYKQGISGFRWGGNATFHPYDSTENQIKTFYCSEFSHELSFENSNNLNVKLRNLNTSLLNKSEQFYVNKYDTYDNSASYELNDVVYYTGNHSYYYWHSSTSDAGLEPAEQYAGKWTTQSGYYVDTNTGSWTRDFLWKPSLGLTVSQNPRLNEVQLGGGYTQLYNDGINESLLNLSLQFNGRDDDETRAMLHFLESHLGSQPFRFSPPAPYDKTRNFICEEWGHSYDFKNSHSVTATFEEYPFNFSAQQYDDQVPPPEMSSGKLVFTSPLSFSNRGESQELTSGNHVKARMNFKNVGDHDIHIYSGELIGDHSLEFFFLGQTGNDNVSITDGVYESADDYIIKIPQRGLPFHLDNQYARISKNYMSSAQGGQFFTLVTGKAGGPSDFINKIVNESSDVYFQNNLGQITSGIEHSTVSKKACDYYILESLFSGNSVTSLAGSSEGYADIVFSGATPNDTLFFLATGAYDAPQSSLIDGDRLLHSDEGGTSTGNIALYEDDRYYYGKMVIYSSDIYSPQTGELRIYISPEE